MLTFNSRLLGFQRMPSKSRELVAWAVAEEQPLEDETMQLVLLALGDALFGAPLARALGLPRHRARDIAYESLIASGVGKRR